MALYRCPFPGCRQITEGPDRKAPPCARCGRPTTRILEPVKVRIIKDWKHS